MAEDRIKSRENSPQIRLIAGGSAPAPQSTERARVMLRWASGSPVSPVHSLNAACTLARSDLVLGVPANALQ